MLSGGSSDLSGHTSLKTLPRISLIFLYVYKILFIEQGPKGDHGMNVFSPFPRKGLLGDVGSQGLPGIRINASGTKTR